MFGAQKVLAVVIFKLGEEVTGSEVLGKVILGAGEAELVYPLRSAIDTQMFVVG